MAVSTAGAPWGPLGPPAYGRPVRPGRLRPWRGGRACAKASGSLTPCRPWGPILEEAFKGDIRSNRSNCCLLSLLNTLVTNWCTFCYFGCWLWDCPSRSAERSKDTTSASGWFWESFVIPFRTYPPLITIVCCWQIRLQDSHADGNLVFQKYSETVKSYEHLIWNPHESLAHHWSRRSKQHPCGWSFRRYPLMKTPVKNRMGGFVFESNRDHHKSRRQP